MRVSSASKRFWQQRATTPELDPDTVQLIVRLPTTTSVRR